MADHELIRETLVSLGEGMEDCGYDAVLETVEGSGIVGRAVRNPRDGDQLRIIILYLKDLAKTIKAEGPSPERTQAMKLLQEAWETMRAAVHEEEEEADVQSRRNAPPPDRPRADLLRTQQAARALPPKRPVPGTVMVAPAPAPAKALPAPRPAQKPAPSMGGHYFRSR
jgi:hypothetical protein